MGIRVPSRAKILGLTREVLVAGLFLVILGSASAYAASPHRSPDADAQSCAACHSVHRAEVSPTADISRFPARSRVVCLDCHDGSDSDASNIVTGTVDAFGLPSGHTIDAEATRTSQVAGCGSCHYAHGSSSEARRIPARRVNGVEVSSSGKDLCLACHDADDSWYGSGYPSTAAPTRDATGYPVSGTWPGPSTYGSANNAHRLIPESTRTVGVSDPILREQGDCLYCHAAHGGANDYDGLVTTFTVPTQATLSSDQRDGSYAALCFSCHGGVRPDGFAATPVDIKQFATASGGSGGHSIVSSDAALPVGSPLPCFECHNAHGSARGNLAQISDERGGSLSTTDAAGVRKFCFTCHSTSDTGSGWDSDADAYTPVSSADEIVGVSRDGGVLALPDGAGHAEGDPESCYDCHGNDYGAGGNNVHNPGDGTSNPTGGLASGALPGIDASASVVVSATVLSSPTVESTGTLPGGVGAAAVADSPPPIGSWNATDLVAPLTVSDAQAEYVASATITLSAVDDTGGAGVADTYHVLDGGVVETGTVVNTSAPGDHTLTFWSVDLAGNVETPSSVSFTVSSEQALIPSRVTAARLGRWIGLRGT